MIINVNKHHLGQLIWSFLGKKICKGYVTGIATEIEDSCTGVEFRITIKAGMEYGDKMIEWSSKDGYLATSREELIEYHLAVLAENISRQEVVVDNLRCKHEWFRKQKEIK